MVVARAAAHAAKQILVVDDDPSVVDLFHSFFEKTPGKYVVHEVLNGEDAVASVRRSPPDLVLLDISMPGMDGFEVLKRILSIDRRIAVMMVSGNSDADPSRALRIGAFAYIPNPTDLAYMEQLVPLALERRRPPKLRFGESSAD